MTARNSTKTRRECLEYWGRADARGIMVLDCYICGEILDAARDQWEAEHELARWLGGSDSPPNVKPVCGPNKGCHKAKTAQDKKIIAKSKRIRDRASGAKVSARPMPGSRRSRWKRRFDGTVVER